MALLLLPSRQNLGLAVLQRRAPAMPLIVARDSQDNQHRLHVVYNNNYSMPIANYRTTATWRILYFERGRDHVNPTVLTRRCVFMMVETWEGLLCDMSQSASTASRAWLAGSAPWTVPCGTPGMTHMPGVPCASLLLHREASVYTEEEQGEADWAVMLPLCSIHELCLQNRPQREVYLSLHDFRRGARTAMVHDMANAH